METWNDNLKHALRRGAKPVVKAEMRGMSTAFLEVRDYTQGAGDSFSVVRNGVTVLTLTEGTHFDAETSNTQTAINIAEYITIYVPGFKVSRFGAKLKIRGGGPGTLTVVVTSTDEDAWFQYRTGFPNRVAFCSDANACEGRYGAELTGFGSSGSSFDLETRKYTLAACDITVASAAGSWGRRLVTSVPVRGQVVELYVGTVDLAESDYELFSTMVVMDYQLGDEAIVFNLAEPQVYAADAKVSAHLVGMHPFDVLKWAWDRTELSSDFWDVPSLDSTTDDEISHWAVSAHGYHFWSAPPNDKRPPGGFEDAKLSEIIEEATRILPGMVRRDAAGVLEYLPFDPEAATVRHFERHDWESATPEVLAENQYTAVAALAPESELFGGGKNVLFRVRDRAAEALTEADEADDGQPTTLPIESRFFGTPAWLRSGVDDAATTLQIWQGAISGISGCRPEDDGLTDAQILANWDRPEYQRLRFEGTFPSATQRAGDEADGGAAPPRTAHYLITNGAQKEIIEATATAYPAGGNQFWYRPAAYLPADGEGGTTVNGDQVAETSILVDDASPFSMEFPFVTFENTGGGTGGTRQISAINYVTNTLLLTSAVSVDDGATALPASGPGFAGGFEFAFVIYNTPIQSVYFPGHAEATVTRGALNTTPRTWTQSVPGPEGTPRVDMTPQVYDLTIAKRICEMQLERFRYGCPIYKLVVGLRHADLQEGDFISFDDERFLWLEHEGATSAVVWEIIGKRVAPIGDSPRVELTVAWVRSDTIPYVTLEDPTWEIPIVSPVSPTPTIPMVEPYYDLTGASYAEDGGGVGLYFPA